VPPTRQYTLSVTDTGSGTVTSSPKGINCGKQCSKTFKVGTSVTLTAKPAKKHSFLGWTGACASSGASLTCTVPMLSDQSVGATFN
jgi:List-Bact-rpt repeat protein